MDIERIYTAPDEHPEVKGFFKHPFEPIWLSKTDDRILTEDGFVEPSIGGEYKYHIRRHLHVLKLETFLVKPTTEVKLWGNHRDGNKRNNLLDNLEWATPSMNITHAFHNGLRSDNLKGFLTDLSNGETRLFISLRACASWLGVNPGKLTTYMKTDRKYPLKFKYSISLLGEDKSPLNADDIGKTRPGANKPCKLVCSLTGEIKYCAFMKSAQTIFGVTEHEIRRIFKEGVFNNWVIKEIETYEEYLKCLEDENVKLANATRPLTKKKEIAQRDSKKVKVTNHLTGEISEFGSVNEFAKINSFGVGEINRALKTKDSWSGFTFEFQE